MTDEEAMINRLREAYLLMEAVLIAKTERAYMRGHGLPRENWAFVKARKELRELHRENAGLLESDLEEVPSDGT